MPLMDVPGARLFYRFDGAVSAPVVVLANSLGTNLRMWDGQIEALTEHFRVLRYDMRGHGASSLSEGAIDIERLAQDVLALLDGLSLERVHFCGLSLGGMVGLWLGARASQRLNRLVLCNTAPLIGPASLWNDRIDAVQQHGMAGIALKVLGRWLSPSFRERDFETAARFWEMLLETTRDGYVAACRAVRDMDLRDCVADVCVPTLIVAGELDQATPAAEARWLAGHIHAAQYVELPAAHLSNVEAEGRFNASVVQFLTAKESTPWTSAND